jgi:hypothetical protein
MSLKETNSGNSVAYTEWSIHLFYSCVPNRQWPVNTPRHRLVGIFSQIRQHDATARSYWRFQPCTIGSYIKTFYLNKITITTESDVLQHLETLFYTYITNSLTHVKKFTFHDFQNVILDWSLKPLKCMNYYCRLSASSPHPQIMII